MMSSDVVVDISWESDWLSRAVNEEIPVLVAVVAVPLDAGANADMEYEHDKTNRADRVACDIFIVFSCSKV